MSWIHSTVKRLTKGSWVSFFGNRKKTPVISFLSKLEEGILEVGGFRHSATPLKLNINTQDSHVSKEILYILF